VLGEAAGIDEIKGGSVMTGNVGIGGATTPGVRVTGMVGTGAAALTPRLPISIEPRGMPVRGAPPGVVGEVGLEDAARLLEPDPHMPDIPAVSIVPDAIESPEVAEILADMPGDAAVPPAAPPVTGIEFATDIPPPS
jgi:hypothetical protein